MGMTPSSRFPSALKRAGVKSVGSAIRKGPERHGSEPTEAGAAATGALIDDLASGSLAVLRVLDANGL